jgi:hypothetical protein
MPVRSIIIDWREDADPEAVDERTLQFVEPIYNSLLPYGVTRVYVKELALPLRTDEIPSKCTL